VRSEIPVWSAMLSTVVASMHCWAKSSVAARATSSSVAKVVDLLVSEEGLFITGSEVCIAGENHF